LRKRAHLVRMRTSVLLSWKNIVTRNVGVRVRGKDWKSKESSGVGSWHGGNEDLALAGRVSGEVMDYLAGKIREIEKVILLRVAGRESYGGLLSLPGVGKVLAWTIHLETGPMGRFADVGNYVSYCRKVPSRWLSDGKAKGQGNRKNGNRYLAWAFSEAAELAASWPGRMRRWRIVP
jgi:transposase